MLPHHQKQTVTRLQEMATLQQRPINVSDLSIVHIYSALVWAGQWWSSSILPGITGNVNTLLGASPKRTNCGRARLLSSRETFFLQGKKDVQNLQRTAFWFSSSLHALLGPSENFSQKPCTRQTACAAAMRTHALPRCLSPAYVMLTDECDGGRRCCKEIIHPILNEH